MAINGMSVGRDYSFAYFDPDTGGIVDFGDVQSVKISPSYHDIKSSPYNDVPKFGHIPDGYRVSFTAMRTGQALENWQLAQNQRFNAGLSIHAGYLNEVVTNPDGTVSRYQYRGVSVKVTDLGDISREKNVTITLEGMASDKVQLS